MALFATFVHNIDPVIGTIFGVHLWWYGISYTLGFLNAHTFISRRSDTLGLNKKSVYDLTLLLAFGVLLGGRAVEVVFYEWPFYEQNLELIPAFWLGGMASHGLLLGGLIGVLIFCRIHNKPFLAVTDALAIPATFILGMGRIGNFIDGQVLGSVTDVPWGVKFPDAEGFRHPVVLYDGIKNLLIIPVLYLAGKRKLPAGVVTGLFLFLYAALRIPVDLFREYPTSLLGLVTGQMLNIVFSLIGIALMVIPYRLKKPESNVYASLDDTDTRWRKLLFLAILLMSLTMPSDWTQDVAARYGHRHAGLTNSVIYPKIDTAPPDVAKQTIP
jgi:phosphatidylglycerol---prolipoprotein diacylglyceryl transferase